MKQESCVRCHTTENIQIHNGSDSLCGKCKDLLHIGNGISIIYGKNRTKQEDVDNWIPDKRGSKKANAKTARAFFVRMQLGFNERSA